MPPTGVRGRTRAPADPSRPVRLRTGCPSPSGPASGAARPRPPRLSAPTRAHRKGRRHPWFGGRRPFRRMSFQPEAGRILRERHDQDRVAQPCPGTDNKLSSQPSGQNTSGPTDKRPTGATGDQSAPSGRTPAPDPIEPCAPTGPEAELSVRDRCASVQHEQRIIEALQAVAKPNPDKVREALNRLGYIDERIHGLKQAGRATHVHLDLRENGGRLCETGRAAGDQPEVTACTAPPPARSPSPTPARQGDARR